MKVSILCQLFGIGCPNPQGEDHDAPDRRLIESMERSTERLGQRIDGVTTELRRMRNEESGIFMRDLAVGQYRPHHPSARRKRRDA